jgi:hypothetical protein
VRASSEHTQPWKAFSAPAKSQAAERKEDELASFARLHREPLPEINKGALAHRVGLDSTVTNPTLKHIRRDADQSGKTLATHEGDEDQFHVIAYYQR